MKVLEVVIHITIDKDHDFGHKQSGYGYMTWDIARSLVSESTNVDLANISYFSNERNIEGVRIHPITTFDLIKNVLKVDLKSFNGISRSYHPKGKEKLKVFFFYIVFEILKNHIVKNHYDVIHIHGFGLSSYPLIKWCHENNHRFAVTLHGLNSFAIEGKASKAERDVERDLIRYTHENGIDVSVVSSGTRAAILSHLKLDASDNFRVILNGVSHGDHPNELDVRALYSLSESDRVFLCVGNIGSGKNQIQLIRAISLIPKNERAKIAFLLVGKDQTNGQIGVLINELGVSSEAILCGAVPRDQMKSYYSAADFVVSTSKAEGFGLPFVEGFAAGLPSITFSDLDAISDIYNEDAMLLIHDRDDQSVTKGIMSMLKHCWDSDKIIDHSRKFSLTQMARQYHEWFSEITGANSP